MQSPSVFLKILLLPPYFVYALAVAVRNMLFNAGILPTAKYNNFSVISVGNLTVGGTGKTPHTEYLLSLLLQEGQPAMLSRGYRRKTGGYVLADAHSTSEDIGDEPFQIKSKFGDRVVVAVDANRRRGITQLQKTYGSSLSAIVLDDAYQHRYVEPGISILLTEFNRLFADDCLLPIGRLREPVHNKNRANIVIVTKCPMIVKPIDLRLITKKLDIKPHQKLYFTHYEYQDFTPVFPVQCSVPLSREQLAGCHVLLFSGIVSQQPFLDYVSSYTDKITTLEYPDHYDYQPKDFEDMQSAFDRISSSKKVIITTEKDAARLQSNPFVPQEFKASMYCLPIKVKFMQGTETEFNDQILNYVRKNKTNSELHTK